MPFGIQPIHIIIVAIVALLIFGPQRLPEIGRGIGRALTEFRKGARDMTESFKEEVSKPVDEPENKIFPAASQPVAPVPQPSPTYVPQPATIAPQPVASTMAAVETAPAATQDPAIDRVFCNQCGAPNPVAAQYCKKCGSKIATD